MDKIINDEDVSLYREALSRHDRWYHYSDDPSVYRKGALEAAQICALRANLSENVANEVVWEVWPDTKPVDPETPWTCNSYIPANRGVCGGEVKVTHEVPYALYGAKGLQNGTCKKCRCRSQLGRPISHFSVAQG